MKFWQTLKKLFKRKKSEWVQKRILITYWTKRGNEAILDLTALEFKPKEGAPSYYIDGMTIIGGEL